MKHRRLVVIVGLTAIAGCLLWISSPTNHTRLIGMSVAGNAADRVASMFAADSRGPNRPPDIVVPPSDGHTGNIWVLPDGGQVHEGPGHTGQDDADYHWHPGNRHGGRSNGPGIPLGENGRPIRTREARARQNGPQDGGQSTNPTGPAPCSWDREGERIRVVTHGGCVPSIVLDDGTVIPGPLDGIPEDQRPYFMASAGRNPGGIKLSDTARGNLGNLRGAVYDPETRSLVLVGSVRQSLPPISEHEWAVLLKCAIEGTDPVFSLDPATDDPGGPRLRCRYEPSWLAGTLVGMRLYNGDLFMKRNVMGLDKLRVPGFRDLFDLRFAGGPSNASTNLSRYWITTAHVGIRRAGSAIVFDDIAMRVQTERMTASSQGLRPTHSQDEDDQWIADFLTAHYGELPPPYQRVRQLAATYALAKFLVAEGVSTDRRWLEQAAEPLVATPDIVDAMDLTRQKEFVTRQHVRGGTLEKTRVTTMTLHGGIRLCASLPQDTSDHDAINLASCVLRMLRGGLSGGSFRLPDGRIASVVRLG